MVIYSYLVEMKKTKISYNLVFLKRKIYRYLWDVFLMLWTSLSLGCDNFAVEMKGLRTLILKSIDEMGRPQDLHVNHLSGLVNHSSIYLFGKLKNPSIIINVTGLPQSLTELTLSASGISDDPMPVLEKLSKLKSLYFYSGSYTGKTMVCSMGGFTQLEVLKFWMLHELEEWIVEEQAMRRLKKLEIRSCKNLKVSTGDRKSVV